MTKLRGNHQWAFWKEVSHSWKGLPRALLVLLLIGAGHKTYAQDRDEQIYRALWAAAQERSLAELQRIFTQPIDMNKEVNGWYPLEIVAANGWGKGITVLLQHGADPYVDSTRKNGAVWFTGDGYQECLTAYHDFGLDFNKPDKNGKTLLMDVVEGGAKISHVQYLLKSGADPKRHDNLGNNVLWYTESLPIVNLMIAAGADVNAKGQGGDTPLIRDCSVDRNSGGYSGFHAIVQRLIAHGADVNAQNDAGDTALIRAAGTRDLLAAQLLLKSHAHIDTQDKKGRDGLQAAIEKQDPEMEQMLLKAGAHLGPQHLLWKAVYAKDSVRLEKALQQGAKPDILDGEGESPLMLAISHDDTASVKSLLAHKADPSFSGAGGETPLMVASYTHHFSQTISPIPVLLIAAGADVNAKEDLYGISALVYAAGASNDYVVGLLIRHGADVNSRDKLGRTVLEVLKIVASEPVSPRIIDQLKAVGAK